MHRPSSVTGPSGSEQLLLGRFTLGRRIDGGAEADLHAGREIGSDRDVAVRISLRASGAVRDGHLGTGLQAELDHPNVMPVLATGPSDIAGDARSGLEVQVMPRAAGGNLRRHLAGRRRSADELARSVAGIAAGLAEVHDRGLVHRDVKPVNILLPAAPGGPPQLIDFGRRGAAGDVRAAGTSGSAHYMSPEQVLGEPITAVGDVYSLGLVLLECLGAERSFTGPSLEVMLARLFRDPVVPASLEVQGGTCIRALPGIPGSARRPAR